MTCDLHVAPDLSWFEAPVDLSYATNDWPDGRTGFSRDVRQDGKVYRRLDGWYYVWLRTMVERATLAGHDMSAEWAHVRQWAVARWGEDEVKKADAMPLASGYRPPGK